MKKIFLILIVLFTLYSCEDKGVTNTSLTGYEEQLPDELKGMKVYTVSVGKGEWIKVAILKGNPTSVTYQSGKSTYTTIIINPNNTKERTIIAKEIISENDSIIVIKKH